MKTKKEILKKLSIVTLLALIAIPQGVITSHAEDVDQYTEKGYRYSESLTDKGRLEAKLALARILLSKDSELVKPIIDSGHTYEQAIYILNEKGVLGQLFFSHTAKLYDIVCELLNIMPVRNENDKVDYKGFELTTTDNVVDDILDLGRMDLKGFEENSLILNHMRIYKAPLAQPNDINQYYVAFPKLTVYDNEEKPHTLNPRLVKLSSLVGNNVIELGPDKYKVNPNLENVDFPVLEDDINIVNNVLTKTDNNNILKSIGGINNPTEADIVKEALNIKEDSPIQLGSDINDPNINRDKDFYIIKDGTFDVGNEDYYRENNQSYTAPDVETHQNGAILIKDDVYRLAEPYIVVTKFSPDKTAKQIRINLKMPRIYFKLNKGNLDFDFNYNYTMGPNNKSFEIELNDYLNGIDKSIYLNDKLEGITIKSIDPQTKEILGTYYVNKTELNSKTLDKTKLNIGNDKKETTLYYLPITILDKAIAKIKEKAPNKADTIGQYKNLRFEPKLVKGYSIYDKIDPEIVDYDYIASEIGPSPQYTLDKYYEGKEKVETKETIDGKVTDDSYNVTANLDSDKDTYIDKIILDKETITPSKGLILRIKKDNTSNISYYYKNIPTLTVKEGDKITKEDLTKLFTNKDLEIVSEIPSTEKEGDSTIQIKLYGKNFTVPVKIEAKVDNNRNTKSDNNQNTNKDTSKEDITDKEGNSNKPISKKKSTHSEVVPTKPNTIRISGSNRFETAKEVAIKANYKSKTAILVHYDKFSDVLTSTPLGKTLNAPILYTKTDEVPKETIDALKELGIDHIILIGSYNTISYKEQKALEKDYKVDRIGGVDRYSTASLIAYYIKEKNPKASDIIIASGETFPDALSISPLALEKSSPILLATKNNLTNFTKHMIDTLIKENKLTKTAYIAGGQATLSNKIEDQLIPYKVSTAYRFEGKDRYDTSYLIAKETNPNTQTSVYVSGEIYQDGLVATSLVDKDHASLLLTKKLSLPTEVKTYLPTSKIINNIIVGGKNTVSDNVKDEIVNLTTR